MQLAVFLDRDGTLNVEKGYIRNVDDMELLPGAAQAVRLLNDAGLLTILTTNQTGAARGFYDEDHIRALNQRVADLIAAESGGRFDAMFYCPHLAKGVVAEYALDCECRKPRIGMVEQALQQFPDIDRSRSYIVGDKASDVAFAHNAGCRGVLLRTGYGQRVLEGKYQSLDQTPWRIHDTILDAAMDIIQTAGTEFGPDLATTA
jgi:D-glycero-D-manno-heptose 1,7-bisphosphate phosphatase